MATGFGFTSPIPPKVGLMTSLKHRERSGPDISQTTKTGAAIASAAAAAIVIGPLAAPVFATLGAVTVGIPAMTAGQAAAVFCGFWGGYLGYNERRGGDPAGRNGKRNDKISAYLDLLTD